MEFIDPATGRPLPSDAIQRILFIGNTVHVYTIPPLSSTRGHVAATWTADPARHIFTARLRVLETSQSDGAAPSSIKVDLVLEDASSGQLFAAAPYVLKAVVEPATDSSRFFALTVRDPSGKKALLGIGFEDRSDAFDFSVALQEARRSLGWEGDGAGLQGGAAKKKEEQPRDYSLKDGETITINLGSKFGRRKPEQQQSPAQSSPLNLQSFALAPPPSAPSSSSSSAGFSLPPPPPGGSSNQRKQTAKDMGFDDGANGEFA
ncbi:hypothetical protein S40288_09162 [Stachybotrys chartarum IBT 40288]|nr:hypothetical protein S40288_09162 [Stachybotrys chartarum IBT 40288]